jgi:hypothetical protein
MIGSSGTFKEKSGFTVIFRPRLGNTILLDTRTSPHREGGKSCCFMILRQPLVPSRLLPTLYSAFYILEKIFINLYTNKFFLNIQTIRATKAKKNGL